MSLHFCSSPHREPWPEATVGSWAVTGQQHSLKMLPAELPVGSDIRESLSPYPPRSQRLSHLLVSSRFRASFTVGLPLGLTPAWPSRPEWAWDGVEGVRHPAHSPRPWKDGVSCRPGSGCAAAGWQLGWSKNNAYSQSFPATFSVASSPFKVCFPGAGRLSFLLILCYRAPASPILGRALPKVKVQPLSHAGRGELFLDAPRHSGLCSPPQGPPWLDMGCELPGLLEQETTNLGAGSSPSSGATAHPRAGERGRVGVGAAGELRASGCQCVWDSRCQPGMWHPQGLPGCQWDFPATRRLAPRFSGSGSAPEAHGNGGSEARGWEAAAASPNPLGLSAWPRAGLGPQPPLPFPGPQPPAPASLL
ncbi:PREDICTED: uncharacterized protein LOC106726939 [Myotis brandtii]|uniref:uncharacterized protein LOC106726939 n=1 Tax=Myotis brandtii TaxID=109478 RepID=UPI000703E052|nr:PREDICTED: uncharacterized protein LOC106726939 [Myotis brandtii]